MTMPSWQVIPHTEQKTMKVFTGELICSARIVSSNPRSITVVTLTHLVKACFLTLRSASLPTFINWDFLNEGRDKLHPSIDQKTRRISMIRAFIHKSKCQLIFTIRTTIWELLYNSKYWKQAKWYINIHCAWH